jgi:hypothetical protein
LTADGKSLQALDFVIQPSLSLSAFLSYVFLEIQVKSRDARTPNGYEEDDDYYNAENLSYPHQGVVAKWLMRLTRNQFPSGA